MIHSKNPLILIIYGPAGSGKGTQAKLLIEKFGLEYFGSGVTLRKRQKVGDFTGNKLKQVMNKGEWVSENTIVKLWMDNLEQCKKKNNFNGWLYDGGARKLLEAQFLNIALKWYEWDKNVKIVYVHISKKEAFNRLTKRRQCKKCGELIPWLGEFKAMKICPKCGGELVYRLDNKLDAIKKRLAEFKKHTIPAMNYLKREFGLIKINGEQSIENVFKDILKVL